MAFFLWLKVEILLTYHVQNKLQIQKLFQYQYDPLFVPHILTPYLSHLYILAFKINNIKFYKNIYRKKYILESLIFHFNLNINAFWNSHLHNMMRNFFISRQIN